MNPFRRRVLAGLALAPMVRMSFAAGTSTEADVLIVGAGMAGLICAQELRKVGYTVIVLEARARIGGRTWTDSSLGVPLDLGGAWIHGVTGNPLTPRVAEAGIQTYATDWESLELYAGDEALEDAEFDRAEKLYESVVRHLRRQQREADSDVDLGSALEIAETELLDDGPTADAARWQLWSEIGSEYADDPDKISLTGWNQGDEFDGDHVLLKSGYGALVNKIAAPLDVRLNTVVESIEHDETGVLIHTSKGDFSADAGVCTVPLGVLKAGKLRFDPALPSAQLKAIKRLGMGVLNKIVLRFKRAFWPATHRFARVDGNPEQRYDFYNLQVMHNQPILVALVAGAWSRQLETLSDQAAVAQVMAELRAMFGEAVTDPVQTVRTRWGSDPYARGSYSLVPPGAEFSDFGAFAEAAGPRLFMAGEATVTDHPGTVHGALLSGIRAAGQVAEVLE